MFKIVLATPIAQPGFVDALIEGIAIDGNNVMTGFYVYRDVDGNRLKSVQFAKQLTDDQLAAIMAIALPLASNVLPAGTQVNDTAQKAGGSALLSNLVVK